MSGLDIAFKETKCVNIRIDLTRDIPITLLDKYHNLSKKDRRMSLREIIYAEDFPVLADIFSEIVSGRETALNAHCRVRVGEDYRWVCLNCSSRKDTFNRSQYLTGIMMDVSEYLDASENEFAIGGTVRKKRDFTPDTAVNVQDASLTEILGEDYLLRIQQALTVTHGISSAFYDGSGKLILSPPDENGRIISQKKTKYKISQEIRCSHQLMAVWTVASDDREALDRTKPLLKVLAETVSQIANAILVLYNEMENSKTANQQLGSNIEQQILLNNIYTIILEQNSADEALNMVIQLVGEYLKLDRVALYDFNPETEYSALKKEWYVKGIEMKFPFTVKDNPQLMEELNYCDTYFSNGCLDDMERTGIKSFVASQLAENGRFVGIIFYETLRQERIWSSADKKLLRNISQIISTMLIRCNMDDAFRQQNEQLKKLAFTDPVLEISNRACLDRDLQENIDNKRPTAVISLKMVNISTINETFGHIRSDNLLKKICEYIEEIKLSGKRTYRFSGSVLMILLNNCSRKDAKDFLDGLAERFSRGWVIDGEEYIIEMNAGAAFYPDDAESSEEIYRCSTLAMYSAAGNGSDFYAFYSKRQDETAGAAFNAEQRLRRAVLNEMDGFSVGYLPIVDPESRIVALEAGVCWCDRENGSVPAGRVIKLAESIGIDELIDSWVINNACGFLREIIDITGRRDLMLNINLTSHELQRSSVHNTISAAIERYELKGENIAVEIPERAQLRIGGDNSLILNRLKGSGVKIVIDDFGREYMSLTALKKNSADIIKIRAEQFCYADESDKAALSSVLSLAHQNGLIVCIKHIETLEQFESVKEYPADIFQGSYLSASSDEIAIKQLFTENGIGIAAGKK